MPFYDCSITTHAGKRLWRGVIEATSLPAATERAVIDFFAKPPYAETEAEHAARARVIALQQHAADEGVTSSARTLKKGKR